MLIDTHAHLTDKRLNAKEIAAAMQQDSLDKIITVGYDMVSSREGLKIAEQHENVYCSLGIHPSDVKSAQDSDINEMLTLASHPKVVAIGEIGLDYHYPDIDKKLQAEWLVKQLDVALKSGLPVIFHLRDAYADMMEIIKQNLSKIKAGAVLHCFSGSLETCRQYIELGFYISFTGVITFPNAAKYTEIIRAVPRDKLLIETDCPYLAPQEFRGQTNRPEFVRCQAEKIAEILSDDVNAVAATTSANAYKLFGKMKKKEH